jgi:hypothetical protein
MSTPLLDRADAPENFELMRSWLKCENHARYNESLGSIPTDDNLLKRLICLSLSDKEEWIMRLVSKESIDVTEDCQYFALSYCRGDPKIVPKTLSSNLHEHMVFTSGLEGVFVHATFDDGYLSTILET